MDTTDTGRLAAHLAAWRTIAEHGWPGSPARRPAVLLAQAQTAALATMARRWRSECIRARGGLRARGAEPTQAVRAHLARVAAWGF